MVELIDTIMSIPSCIQVKTGISLYFILFTKPNNQDQQSKIDVVNKWIKEHKKYEGAENDKEIEEIEENNNKEASQEREKQHMESSNNKKDVDNCTSLENEQTEIVSDNFSSMKRGKNSRFASKSGRKTLKKLKELDIATKTVNIYQSFEKEEELKNKILYKEFRRHKNFLLCFFGTLAPWHAFQSFYLSSLWWNLCKDTDQYWISGGRNLSYLDWWVSQT